SRTILRRVRHRGRLPGRCARRAHRRRRHRVPWRRRRPEQSRSALRDALRPAPQCSPVARLGIPRLRARAARALSDTFSNVDASSDAAGAIAWQERIDAWPQIRAYKQRSYEWCGEQGPRLDIGAGPGTDAVALGAFATDLSLAMCSAAAARGIAVCRADAHALPFADASFGAVRPDRVLQHVSDPECAIAEMVRVTALGGCVVASDPDQSTLEIELPGAPAALVAKVITTRREIGYRHGTIAGRMTEL